MRALPAPLLSQLRKSETDKPWLVLYEIPVDDTDTYRLVNQSTPVEWCGKTFQPYPVSHGEVKSQGDGSLPTLELTVSNITREVESVMDAHDGLVGKVVTISLVHKDFLSDPGVASSVKLKIGSSSYDSRAAVFALVMQGMMNAAYPPHRYMRTRCRWVYKSAGCGYVGTLPTCAKTFEDCDAHGDDDDANNRPVLHPLRFGGQPGIARFG